MRIALRTTGALAHHLPPGARGNRAALEVAADASIADVLARLALPQGRAYLTSVNGQVVPPDSWSTHRLAEADELAILSPLRGG